MFEQTLEWLVNRDIVWHQPNDCLDRIDFWSDSPLSAKIVLPEVSVNDDQFKPGHPGVGRVIRPLADVGYLVFGDVGQLRPGVGEQVVQKCGVMAL